jgi:hypothetical protein
MTRDKGPQRFAVGFGQCPQHEGVGLGNRQKVLDEIHAFRKNQTMLLHCFQQKQGQPLK